MLIRSAFGDHCGRRDRRLRLTRSSHSWLMANTASPPTAITASPGMAVYLGQFIITAQMSCAGTLWYNGITIAIFIDKASAID